MIDRVFPDEIECSRVVLTFLRLADSEELFELIDSERERLGRWLSWVSSCQSVEDVRERRRTNVTRRAEGSLFDYAISLPGADTTRKIIGACGAFGFSEDGLSCELGYWIGEAHEGRGLTTEAIIGLQDVCFRQGIEEIRISCVPENERSASIPRRLGYRRKKHSGTDRGLRSARIQPPHDPLRLTVHGLRSLPFSGGSQSSRQRETFGHYPWVRLRALPAQSLRRDQ